MSKTNPSTRLEKRTIKLLVAVAVAGSLFGIMGIAMPYYLFFSTPSMLNWCDSCQNVDALIAHSRHVTLTIIVISVVLSFLPLVLYAMWLLCVRWWRRKALTHVPPPEGNQ